MGSLIVRPHIFNTRGTQYIPLTDGVNVEQMMGEIEIPSGMAPYMECFIQGVHIERKEWTITYPMDGDHILIAAVPHGGDDSGKAILRLVATIALTYVTFGLGGLSGGGYVAGIGTATQGGLLAAGAFIAGTLAIHALFPPPSIDSNGGSGSESPALTIQGQRNIAKPFQVVPRLYGRTIMYPPLAAEPYLQNVGLRNKFLYMLFDLGYGDIRVEDPKLGDTPTSQLEGVQMNRRVGISKNIKFTKYTKDIQTLRLAVNLKQREENIRVTDKDTDSVQIDITFPTGLTSFDNDGSGAGSKRNRSCVHSIQFRKVGATNWLSMGEANSYSFSHQRVEVIESNLPGSARGVALGANLNFWGNTQNTAISGTKIYWNGSEFGTVDDVPVVAVGARVNPPKIGFPEGSLSMVGTPDNAILPGSTMIIDGNRYIIKNNYVANVEAAIMITPALENDFITIPYEFNKDGAYTPVQNYLSGGNVLYHSALNFIITEATLVPFTITTTLEFASPDEYEIKVIRNTPDPDEDDNTYGASASSWTALRSIKNRSAVNFDKNHTFIEMKIKANDELNGVIDDFNFIGSSKLSVGFVEDGLGHNDLYTRNQAWIIKDILTGDVAPNPVLITDLDYTSFRAFAVWCDKLTSADSNSIEPQFRFDAVIDYKTTVFELAKSVAASARGVLTHSQDGKYIILFDEQPTIPVQLFTTHNSWGFSGSRMFPIIPNALKIGFVDPDAGWQRAERIVYNDGYSPIVGAVPDENEFDDYIRGVIKPELWVQGYQGIKNSGTNGVWTLEGAPGYSAGSCIATGATFVYGGGLSVCGKMIDQGGGPVECQFLNADINAWTFVDPRYSAYSATQATPMRLSITGKDLVVQGATLKQSFRMIQGWTINYYAAGISTTYLPAPNNPPRYPKSSIQIDESAVSGSNSIMVLTKWSSHVGGTLKWGNDGGPGIKQGTYTQPTGGASSPSSTGTIQVTHDEGWDQIATQNLITAVMDVSVSGHAGFNWYWLDNLSFIGNKDYTFGFIHQWSGTRYGLTAGATQILYSSSRVSPISNIRIFWENGVLKVNHDGIDYAFAFAFAGEPLSLYLLRYNFIANTLELWQSGLLLETLTSVVAAAAATMTVEGIGNTGNSINNAMFPLANPFQHLFYVSREITTGEIAGLQNALDTGTCVPLEFPLTFETINLLGVTRATQAWRDGRYHLFSAILRQEVFTLSADVENLVCTQGDLIKVQHEASRIGGFPTRISAINSATITSDEIIELGVGPLYRVTIREVRNNINDLVTYDVVSQPTPNSLILNATVTATIGDLFVYGDLNFVTDDFLVKEIQPGPDLTATLTLIGLAPKIYTADTSDIPEWNPKISPTKAVMPPEVQGIVAVQSLVSYQGNFPITSLRLNWDGNDENVTAAYEVYRLKGDDWVLLGETSESTFSVWEAQILDGKTESDMLVGQIMYFKVLGRGPTGLKQSLEWITAVEIILTSGISGLLPIELFRIEEVNGVLTAYWQVNPLDISIDYFQIRYVFYKLSEVDTLSSWEAANVGVSNIPASARSVVVPPRLGSYYIKARDTSGNWGPWSGAETSTNPYRNIKTLDLIREYPLWEGAKDNFQIVGNELVMTDIFKRKAIYYFKNSLEFANKQQVRIYSILDAEYTVSGTPNDGWVSILEYAFGDGQGVMSDWITLTATDPIGDSSAAFTPWQGIQAGDINALEIKFRLVVELVDDQIDANADFRVRDSTANLFFAQPIAFLMPRTESGVGSFNQSPPAADTVITFDKPFAPSDFNGSIVPAISINLDIQDNQTIYEIKLLTNTGFSLQISGQGSAPIGLSWVAQGHGLLDDGDDIPN